MGLATVIIAAFTVAYISIFIKIINHVEDRKWAAFIGILAIVVIKLLSEKVKGLDPNTLKDLDKAIISFFTNL